MLWRARIAHKRRFGLVAEQMPRNLAQLESRVWESKKTFAQVSRQPVRHVVALDTDPALLEVARHRLRKAMKGSAISSCAMLKKFCGTRVRSAARNVGVGALVGDFSWKA